MESFSIQNIKAFKEQAEIELKPITILVGRNSCGKSSLIRFPVVLAQSFDENSNNPIKLYGKMLDYGTFSDIVFNHNGKSITFSLSYSIPVSQSVYGFFRKNVFNYDDNDCRIVKLETTLSQLKEEIKVASQSMIIDNQKIYEYIDDGENKQFQIGGFYDNEKRCFDEERYVIYCENLNQKWFFCLPEERSLKQCIKDSYFPDVEFELDNPIREYVFEELLYGHYQSKSFDNLRNEIRKPLPRLDVLQLTGYEHYLPDATVISYPLGFLKGYESLKNKDNQKKKILKGVNANSELKNLSKDLYKDLINGKGNISIELKFWHVYNCFIYYRRLMNLFVKKCYDDIHGLSYIGPFRDNPSRIYRDSNSSPTSVGVRGEDACNVLFDDYQKNKKLIKVVSEWLNKTLGYKLCVEKVSNGYYQLLVEDNHGNKSNIIDVGYGISQLLPVIVQALSQSSSGEELLIIEQPELHLHPAAQAELAELFVSCIELDPSKKLVIETHSEHFIRKLQVLVANKNNKFSCEDVAIYYVDSSEQGGSLLEKLNMLPNGQFEKEWPSGFFDKSFNLTMELLEASLKD